MTGNNNGLTLETQSISAECRANRHPIPAWWAAVERLRDVYDAQIARFPEDTIELVIRRVPAGGDLA